MSIFLSCNIANARFHTDHPRNVLWPVSAKWQLNLPKTRQVDHHETQAAPGVIDARGTNT
jgi:hypothetical protein